MFIYYKQRWLLLCFILWSGFGLPTSNSSLDPDEAQTLRQIARTTGLLDSSANSPENKEAYSWLIIKDPCSMVKPYLVEGKVNLSVECNHCSSNNVCHITTLFMKDLSLPGMLPKELVNLTYLEKIDFTRNCLEGSLPKEWAVMKHLNFISLTANRLSGEIPKEWGNFSNLTYLSVEANNLSGTVPQELGKLVTLTTLILTTNKFGGTLPKMLGDLKNLTDLRISDNSFEGSIPEFIGSLSELKRLHMHATGMRGPIPSQTFQGLEKLEDIRITDINSKESAFPNLDSNKNIKQLILRNLNLSGPIPKSIWDMEMLSMLDVSFNKLEGGLPDKELITALKYRFMGGNKLNGTVPEQFLVKVNYVDISYNNFNWTTSCDFSMEKVNLYRSSALTKNDGRLLPCSNIPNCQQSRRSSVHINCGGPNVTIKNAKGSLLYEGDIYGTELNYIGTHWGFSSTGNFMNEKDNDREKYVDDNKEYSGELVTFYDTIRKSPLSLMYYACLQNGNYTIKLHFPDITSRAEGYNQLTRHYFDIYIQENLMRKDFSIEVEANKTGNKAVVEPSFNATVTDNRLEIRFYWAGKGTTLIPVRGNYGILISAISVCPSSKSHCEEPRKTSRKPIIVGAITSVLCLIFLVVGVIAWRTNRNKTTRERELAGLELITGSFSLRQLRAATNNFDSANKIGESGFGSVYKGELADGTVIAVKKFSSKSRQGNREFVTEIGIISGLQHPNLVKFYGCCIDGNHLLLVYEYMENNCLGRALFGTSKAGESLKLDWAVRMKICFGIAKGLAFLHEGSALKIVHRDIKATNVLLDRDLNAKISDFGLAKLHEEDESHISTRIAGTIGYMAPEYALWGILTEKADVYSFGVVALEIVSGKNNTSYRPQNDCVCLLDYAFVLQKRKNLMEIVDPNLGNEFNKKEAEKIIKVAMLCTNASALLRPTMSEVVSFLEGEGTLVGEVISDPRIYGDDLESDVRFKSLRNYNQQIQKKNNEENKDQAEPSSSTSVHDLYPINSESINFSSKDLELINTDSTSKSEFSSLISHHSS